jgi:hypothetical protein
MDEVEPQDGHKHQESGGLGVDEELDRRLYPPFVAPQCNEEVEGHEHHLEEEVEEEKIERHEHTRESGRRPHEMEVEKADAGVDSVPRCDHGQPGQREREHEHDEAQAIDRKVKADA